MESMTEILYGKEFADRLEEFKSELNKIEEANIEWFKSRKPKFESEKHDKLHHHYLIRWDKSSIGFGFREDSDVPNHIKQECQGLFKKYFPNKDP